MLTLKDITLQIGDDPNTHTLLHRVSAVFPAKRFTGIIGPSGSGKSTLLKVVAGLHEATDGSVNWQGRDLAEEDLPPGQIGYVPQFGIAYDHLTVEESVEAAVRLRVRGLSRGQVRARTLRILWEVGLDEIAKRRVGVLSGGEKRRLALALEMVSSPSLLLCDEVTSGLDPKTEEEIVALLRRLSRQHNCVALAVTHSFRHLQLYDSIVVLHQGSLVYHGPTRSLVEYFQVESPEGIFSLLASQPATTWADKWREASAQYEGAVMRPSAEDPAPKKPDETAPHPPDADEEEVGHDAAIPDAITQFVVLLGRRWRIFFRDRSQAWLHLSLLLGFPCLVVIFALNGLPQIQNLNMGVDVNVVEQLRETNTFILQSTRVGSLVSGLVMFQVILLALMGSNNSAREIASERLIFEKERLGGLRPISYLASKSCFLFVLVAAQSVWMAAFVNLICQFPGDFVLRATCLLMVNAAMTAICLGISSLMKSAEQASLVSIYLVGFQLPLSGAVLALPETLGVLTRPFIAAYWSWSGVLQTMRDTRFYDVVQTVTRTELSVIPLCLWALGSHVVLGLVLAYLGCKRSRWE